MTHRVIDADTLYNQLGSTPWNGSNTYIPSVNQYVGDPLQTAMNSHGDEMVEVIKQVCGKMMQEQMYSLQSCIMNSTIEQDINLGVLKKALESDNPQVKVAMEQLKMVVCLAHGDELD